MLVQTTGWQLSADLQLHSHKTGRNTMLGAGQSYCDNFSYHDMIVK